VCRAAGAAAPRAGRSLACAVNSSCVVHTGTASHSRLSGSARGGAAPRGAGPRARRGCRGAGGLAALGPAPRGPPAPARARESGARRSGRAGARRRAGICHGGPPSLGPAAPWWARRRRGGPGTHVRMACREEDAHVMPGRTAWAGSHPRTMVLWASSLLWRSGAGDWGARGSPQTNKQQRLRALRARGETADSAVVSSFPTRSST
jgi:DNA polymerase III subunit alpha